MKERIFKLYFIKIKDFCFVKDTAKRMKDKPQTGSKYWQKSYLIKTIIQSIQRTFNTQNKKTT